MEYTFSIIKPDAVNRNIIGKILDILEGAGLKVVAQKMVKITEEQAKEFYFEHNGKPFFNTLVTNITAGPVVVQVLKGENAILKNREIMGATNPEEALPNTIRKKFALSIDLNSVHGSDSKESAKREIAFFFSSFDIYA